MVVGTGVVSYNGGSINAGGFIGTVSSNPFNGNGYIRPIAALTGSQTINVWIVSSYIPDNVPLVTNLKQAA